MARKSSFLQIRLTPEEKQALQRAARRAGQSVSEYTIARVLPSASLRFGELLRALADRERRSYVLAELNDLLASLGATQLAEAVAEQPPAVLSPYLRNYVAAMVEQAAHRKEVAPPGWVGEIEPLEEPRFVTTLPGLRLHLLAAAPVPFRRRNIFVDSSVGDRV